MKTYAIIENESVVNIALWDGITLWTPEENCIVVLIPEESLVSIGWSYINGEFVDPSA